MYTFGVRGGSREKESILIAHGINSDGKRVVLHLSPGVREGTRSWEVAVDDLAERGIKPPRLIITDSNQELLRALEEVWQEMPRQRRVVHRTRTAW